LGDQLVEQRDGRARGDGGAVAERLFPPVLECLFEFVAHAVGHVGVQAAHAGDLVAETLFGEDLGDAVFGHPGLVPVPQAVHRQARLDGCASRRASS